MVPLLTYGGKKWEVKPPGIWIWPFKFIEENVQGRIVKTALGNIANIKEVRLYILIVEFLKMKSLMKFFCQILVLK